jgi:pimeloyl-ACP methyl ester carboxylesterase/putative sterol carrier protein
VTVHRPGGGEVRLGGTKSRVGSLDDPRDTGLLDPFDDVRASFLRLAERFHPEEARGLDATFGIEVADHSPMTVHVRGERCLVSPGRSRLADATLHASPSTWIDLVEGRVDGIAAFLAGRLRIEGDLNLASRFETLFHPTPHAARVIRTRETAVRGVRIESTVGGEGPPVVLLHGLGASKVSFLPTLDGLADRYEVHALDLPGFGKSSKPLPTGRRYSMAWHADAVQGYLVANGIPDAHLVGNSMGGRIALETALRHPRSVRSVVGLGPAVGFDEYRLFGPLLRLTQAQWVGVMPSMVSRTMVEGLVRDLFYDPRRVPADNYKAAANDVLLSLRDPAHRLALLACARRLGAERARGKRAYWQRLAGLATPSFWIFGTHDKLVSSRYAARVERILPAAKVEVWSEMGHVPQFESPDRTNESLSQWFSRIEAGR